MSQISGRLPRHSAQLAMPSAHCLLVGSLARSVRNSHWVSKRPKNQRCEAVLAVSEVAALLAPMGAAPPPVLEAATVPLAAGFTVYSPAYDLAGLYSLIDQIDGLVGQQLTRLTPASFAVVLAAGLATSLSPCTLSVLPLTIGYIGGYSNSSSSGSSQPSSSTAEPAVNSGSDRVMDSASSAEGNARAAPPASSSALGARQDRRNANSSLVVRAAAFSAGLATTLAGLGVLSTLVGSAYGQIGDGLPIAVSLVAIVMGLNLLEVLPLRLPSLDLDVRGLDALRGLPPGTRAALQAYLAGLTFALAASPCSTPVLATLLAWVSTTQDPLAGAALLLAYSLGYVAPLLAAALFTGALTQLLAVRQWSAWVTPASGVLLLVGGTYALLSRLVPA